MSHELRTPLNAIIALSGVLHRSLINKIPEDESNYLEIIHRSGKNLLNMINDILDLSRIESGHVELEITTFRINRVLDRVVEIMKPLADAKHIDLIFNESDPAVDVRSDPDKIEHVFQNLVSNAIKFTDQGRVTISLTKTKTHAVIAFEDTGIGISEAHIPFIFDEFRQADSSITRRFGGTGLGLSIVKKYLDMLDGRIAVNSVPGQGTAFIVEIQLDTAREVLSVD
jgi:signal transduction histidine kinase